MPNQPQLSKSTPLPSQRASPLAHHQPSPHSPPRRGRVRAQHCCAPCLHDRRNLNLRFSSLLRLEHSNASQPLRLISSLLHFSIPTPLRASPTALRDRAASARAPTKELEHLASSLPSQRRPNHSSWRRWTHPLLLEPACHHHPQARFLARPNSKSPPIQTHPSTSRSSRTSPYLSPCNDAVEPGPQTPRTRPHAKLIASSAHTRAGRASDWRQARPTSLPSYVREPAVRKSQAQR